MPGREVVVEAIWSDDELGVKGSRRLEICELLVANQPLAPEGGPSFHLTVKKVTRSAQVFPTLKKAWGNAPRGPFRLWIADIQFGNTPDGIDHLKKVFLSPEGQDIGTNMLIVLSGHQEYENEVNRIVGKAHAIWTRRGDPRELKHECLGVQATARGIVNAIGRLIRRCPAR